MKHQDQWLNNPLKPYFRFQQAHNNSIECLQFNQNNQQELASGSHDHLVKLWDINHQKETQKLVGHTAGIWSLTYLNHQQQIVSGSADRSIIIWDPKSGKSIITEKQHENEIYTIATSDDGRYLASGGRDGHLILWDLKKFGVIKNIKVSMDIVLNLQFSENNKYIFLCDSTGILKSFDTESLQELASIKSTSKTKFYALQSLKCENETYKIFIAQKNNNISEYIFDSNEQKLIKQYEAEVHSDSIHCLNLNKDHNMIATGSGDGASTIWEIKKQNEYYPVVHNLLDHNERISGIEFNQNGKIVASCSWDQNINFYKL